MIVLYVLGYILIGMAVAMGIDSIAGLEEGHYPFVGMFWPVIVGAVSVVLPFVVAGYAAKELMFAIRRWREKT